MKSTYRAQPVRPGVVDEHVHRPELLQRLFKSRSVSRPHPLVDNHSPPFLPTPSLSLPQKKPLVPVVPDHELRPQGNFRKGNLKGKGNAPIAPAPHTRRAPRAARRRTAQTRRRPRRSGRTARAAGPAAACGCTPAPSGRPPRRTTRPGPARWPPRRLFVFTPPFSFRISRFSTTNHSGEHYEEE